MDAPTSQRVGRRRATQGRSEIGLAPHINELAGDLARFARRPDAGGLPAFELGRELRPTGSTETCSRLIPATHPVRPSGESATRVQGGTRRAGLEGMLYALGVLFGKRDLDRLTASEGERWLTVSSRPRGGFM